MKSLGLIENVMYTHQYQLITRIYISEKSKIKLTLDEFLEKYLLNRNLVVERRKLNIVN